MVQIQTLEEIFGPENVFDDSETLESYSKDQSFVHAKKPDFVVKPPNSEVVRLLVEWANKHSVPLIPVSSPGGPRFHGDTVPDQGGIIVDLSLMKKVLNVDRRDKVARIEPGVTFNQLDSELEVHGLTSYKPLLPRQKKSVLTSYLEREPITVPKDHWDALDPLACVEVVFGTGDVFKTGSASGPGTITEQMEAGMKHVNPMGPGLTSPSRLIQGAQGTLGIVTWATVICRLVPAIQKIYFVPSENLEALCELAYTLLKCRLGEELFLINKLSLACIMADKAEEIPELSSSLPSWILVFNLTGNEFFPEEKIDYQEKDAKEYAGHLGLEPALSVGDVSGADLLKRLENPPDQYHKLRYKGGCHDISFLTTMDKGPSFISRLEKTLIEFQYPIEDLAVYFQPVVQGCACHCEFTLAYDPSREDEVKRIEELFRKSCEEMIDCGAFFSRPYGSLAELVFDRDEQSASALRKVKSIFDPKNILNPGKLCF